MQPKEQNISPIKQRILQFAGTLGISKREFYSIIKVSRGTLESKTGITEDVIAKFIAAYPQVNVVWLITGEGDMLASPSESDGSVPTDVSQSELLDKLLQKTEEVGRLKARISELEMNDGRE